MRVLCLLALHIKSKLALTIALLALGLTGSQVYDYALRHLEEAAAILTALESARTLMVVDIGVVSSEGLLTLEPVELPEPVRKLIESLSGIEGVRAVYPIYELAIGGYRVLCGPPRAFQSLALPYVLVEGRWPSKPGEAVSTTGSAPAPLKVVGRVMSALPAEESVVLGYCWSAGTPRFIVVAIASPEYAVSVEREVLKLLRELGLQAGVAAMAPLEELERLVTSKRTAGVGYAAASVTLLSLAPVAVACAEARLYRGLALLYAQAGISRPKLALLEAARFALALSPAALSPQPLASYAAATLGVAVAAALASGVAAGNGSTPR